MFSRKLQVKMEGNLSKQKVLLIFGARRVGKTEILFELYEKYKNKTLWLNGENAGTSALLEHRTEANYRKL